MSLGYEPSGPLGLSSEANNFNWLLQAFSAQTSGVTDAVAVSSDGLLIAASRAGDRATADRLAAVISGITSLAFGASTTRNLGTLDKVIVDYSGGYLLVASIAAGCVLGVVAEKGASLSNLAYEITLFANRAGETLTPRLINELKNSSQQ
ncbi:roadblock/LC7 domain-containing protein [Streptomyces sp. NPDC046977]|uniref:roadblock/LC7 domain-containing protein n=1 Tax=Streptomyces sp. NPDC046977 TaxID=3154703 RepID=UPI0033FD4B68